jgi:hypothetical protein
MKINCWESLFIHPFQQEDILINKQAVSDLNPLFNWLTSQDVHHIVQCLLQFISHHTRIQETPTQVTSITYNTI